MLPNMHLKWSLWIALPLSIKSLEKCASSEFINVVVEAQFSQMILSPLCMTPLPLWAAFINAPSVHPWELAFMFENYTVQDVTLLRNSISHAYSLQKYLKNQKIFWYKSVECKFGLLPVWISIILNIAILGSRLNLHFINNYNARLISDNAMTITRMNLFVSKLDNKEFNLANSI